VLLIFRIESGVFQKVMQFISGEKNPPYLAGKKDFLFTRTNPSFSAGRPSGTPS
jgi:hypothetical protein